MWDYLLLGAGAFGLYGSGYSMRDVASIGSVPWYGLASGVLAIRYYHELLARLSYILLLLYWYVYVSKGGYLQSTQYTDILGELVRSRYSDHGERDYFGTHWSINIAQFFIYHAINDVMDFIATNWFWSRLIFNLFLQLLLFGHYVWQLFLQRQMRTLERFDQSIYRFRDYGLECLWAAVIRRLDNQVTRALVYMWFWTCHYVYQHFKADFVSQFVTNLSALKILIWFMDGKTPNLSWADRMVQFSTVYFIWLRELARFSDPNPPTFKYSKLKEPDHIRLVLLHPRFGFRPISCTIMDGPYMRLLFYEAISYTWGNPDKTEEILVNGCRMKVTKSVYEVLATLSSQFLPQLLWIDAICIDQGNSAEKDLQVPIMDKIYSNALFTTVFLGQSPLLETQSAKCNDFLPYHFEGISPPDDQTREHFETARLTFDTFREFHILKEPLRSSGKDIYELYDPFLSEASRSRQWTALLTFLRHPWFARVWVVQEVALSPHVQVRYGDEVIDWQYIASAMQMIHNLRHFRLWLEWSHQVQIRHTENSSLYNIIRMNKLRESLWPTEKYSYAENITITQVLAESSYFKATNPRDQVYGLMSLCTDRTTLSVDYEASVESVYLAAATELISKQSFGLLFGLAGVGNRPDARPTDLELPSWVPDWTNAPKYDRISHPEEESFDFRWKAKRGENKVPDPSIKLADEKTLLISGVFVDLIAEVGPSLFGTAGAEGDGVIDEMQQLWQNYSTLR